MVNNEKEDIVYSPKIKEPLVKELYKLKLVTGHPMTKLTNSILEKGISKMKNKVNSKNKEDNNG